MTDWFARPIFSVTDVEVSLRFYVDRLGSINPWRFDEGGKAYVAQVERQGCASILSKTWPEKIGKGLLFVSPNVESPTPEAATAALDQLRAELEARGVPVKEGSSNCENDPAEGATLYEVTESLSRFCQRKGPSHDRFDRAGLE